MKNSQKRVGKHWNRLPKDVVESPSLEEFNSLFNKMWHFRTQLLGMVVMGWRLDWMIIVVFSKLNDSLKPPDEETATSQVADLYQQLNTSPSVSLMITFLSTVRKGNQWTMFLRYNRWCSSLSSNFLTLFLLKLFSLIIATWHLLLFCC